MKNYISVMTLVTSTIFLSACDSGGKSSGSISSNNEPITQPDTPLSNDIASSTADLKAPDTMKFISHKRINFLTDISNLGGGPAYLSIYSDFHFFNKLNVNSSDYTQWKTNHNSRVLSSSIENNKLENHFAIPQHITRLLVQVWFYDDRKPVAKEIEIADDISIIW